MPMLFCAEMIRRQLIQCSKENCEKTIADTGKRSFAVFA